MKFQFDGNQEFQVAAVEAVVGLLSGQPKRSLEITFELGTDLAAIPNRLDLDDSAILRNLQEVQTDNGINPDDQLIHIEELIEEDGRDQPIRFPNFSVEMETGTGKTYVYIRTALELNRRYGLQKFIIVVPSIAIREGVLKDLTMTRQHFRQLFENVPYRFSAYDSANVSQVRQFALADSVELMVMTIDSFNKATNVMNQSLDQLQGERPINLVRSARPILILDEPQNMESELRVRALATLHPLFALRYSATHRNPYNVVYRLSPFEAYRQGLVKRIEVASVTRDTETGQPFIRLERVDTKKKTVTARIAIHQLMKTGAVKEKSVTVRPGDSLEDKSGRPEYEGFEVDEINPGSGFIRFANNAELAVGESQGADRDAIFEAQIRYTIEEHFRKQSRLRARGIKVLSLFFIDRVDNYVADDGIIRRLFDQAFNDLRLAHPEWKDTEPAQVQGSYFAQKRRRGGAVEVLDSVSGETKEDTAAYDLILRDKERLLSIEEPVAFVFSHSALREGWDNPNVFQICTLNQTISDMKKRQEVGRGVRLCRDQDGERVHDERVNVLTVVANESYQHYVAQLQTEISDEYGTEGLPPKPGDARKRGVARLRKEFTLKSEFQQLWDRIKHKTRYAVKIDTKAFLADVVPRIDKITVRPPRVAITKAQVRVGTPDLFEAIQLSAAKTAIDLVGRYPLPNLIDTMSHLMEHTTPRVRLTRRTLLAALRQTSNRVAAVHNPQEFATEATRIMKDRLADHLVDGIQYEKLNEWYEMSQFDPEIDSWEQYLVPTAYSIYDQVVFDSQVERDFVEGLEKRDDVKLYVKLPGWFTVDTPVGEYNPDWAIVIEDRDAHADRTGKPLLYLVRETKDEGFRRNPRAAERRKVVCGRQHFQGALGVNYKVVTTASELP